MRIVAALGGNALLGRGETPDASIQQHHIVAAVAALGPLARDHELLITHGNGPQVGVLALESAKDTMLSGPYPFDVLGAQTQGMIGYWLVQALENVLPGRDVAGLITQTLVSIADPAFSSPTNHIGPVYTEKEALALASTAGWTVKADGRYWRRVVPSPVPHRVVETRLIDRLLGSGTVVVCAGGGGAPVIRNPDGNLEGIEAVVDKDAVAGLLAEAVDADMLLLLTDIAAVETNHGAPTAQPIKRSTPGALRAMSFPPGSMGPKVEAVCRFVELTGGTGIIGGLGDTAALIAGEAGTIVTPDGIYPR